MDADTVKHLFLHVITIFAVDANADADVVNLFCCRAHYCKGYIQANLIYSKSAIIHIIILQHNKLMLDF